MVLTKRIAPSGGADTAAKPAKSAEAKAKAKAGSDADADGAATGRCRRAV